MVLTMRVLSKFFADNTALKAENNNVLRTPTELWDSETREGQIINPTLFQTYSYGIGLFLVDPDFCNLH